MRASIIILLFVSPAFCLFGQRNVIDSLELELKRKLPDTLRVDILNSLASEYQLRNIQTLYTYSIQAKTISEKINYKKGLAIAMCYMGIYHSSNKEYEKAEVLYDQALATLPDEFSIAKVKLLNTIASNQSNYTLKYNYLNQAITLAEKIQFHKIGTLYHNMANWYYNQSHYENAFQYYMKGLKAAEVSHDSLSMLINIDGMGSVLAAQGNEKTIHYKRRALAIAEKLNDAGYISLIKCHFISYYQKKQLYDSAIAVGHETIALAKEANDYYTVSNALSDMGYTYQLKGDASKAIEHYHQSLQFINHIGSGATKLKVTVLSKLGEAYNGRQQYNQAITYLKQAVNQGTAINAKSDLTSAYNQLSNAYYQTSNFKEAYHYNQLHTILKDSIYGIESQKQIAAISTKYEVEKKDQDIMILEQNSKIKDLQLSRARFQSIALIVLCILILITLAFLYNRYRIKNKVSQLMQQANRQMEETHLKLLVSMGEKEVLLQEIHHRVKNNLQLISSLLQWQTENIRDDRVLRAISEGRSRIKSMALIHESLYQSDNLAHLNLDEYIGNLVNYLKQLHDRDSRVTIHKRIEAISVDVDIAVPLGLIITELVTNAYKYAFPFHQEGTIEVLLYSETNGTHILKIKDDGVGMSEELIHTTEHQTMGIELVKLLVQQIKGNIRMYNDDGACIVVRFNNIHYRENAIHSYEEAYQNSNS